MTEQTDYNFQVHNHYIVRDWLALDQAENFVTVGSGSGVTQVQQTIDVDAWGTIALYRGKTENILTKESLDRIRFLEQKFLNETKYSNFCLVNATSSLCSDDALQTALDFIPASYSQLEIDGQLQYFANQIDLGTDFGLKIKGFFGKEFTSTNLQTRYLRSFLRYGGPLAGYTNTEEKEKDQDSKFESYMEPHVDRILNSENRLLEPLIAGNAVWNLVFQRLIAEDLSWAFFSMLFVYIFMIYHTSSLFLASMGILEILLAFPFAFYFYNVLFGINLFESLHVMSVFIILGIGADDIFVFVDAWHQALVFEELRNDVVLRMCWTWRRASMTMLVTSVTTCGAFLATGISRIAPIAAFGIWAACLIAANYILVISYFPACVVIYHKYTQYCCSKRTKETDPHTGVKSVDGDKENVVVVKPTIDTPAGSRDQKTIDNSGDSSASSRNLTKSTEQGSSSIELQVAPKHSSDDQKESHDETIDEGDDNAREISHSTSQSHTSLAEAAAEGNELRTIERFFYFKWSHWINKYRYITLGFFFVFIIASIATAAQLAPLSEQEQWLPDDHFITRTLDLLDHKFVRSEFDNTIKVHIVWGISGIDRSDTDKWVTDDLGRVIFDKSFDGSTAAAQSYLLQVCSDLRDNDLVLDRNLNCFIEDYKLWREENGEAFPAVFSADADQQRADFTDSLLEFAAEFRTNRGLDYEADFSIGIDPVAKELKFLKIDAISPLRPFLPYSTTKPVYDDWTDYVEALNFPAPVGFNKAYQTAKDAWGSMVTERELVINAVQGMAIALSVALAALALSTLNIVISLYAILTIIGIVATVTASMVAQGWELGISQSVAVVLLIGFSVDYVVHLANSYVESHRDTRFEKMQDSVTTMGISVVSGAATTFGASLFLYGTTILFFQNFAIMMSTTVCFALFYSMCFFTTLCSAFGPTGTTGDLKHYFNVLVAKYKARKQAA